MITRTDKITYFDY